MVFGADNGAIALRTDLNTTAFGANIVRYDNTYTVKEKIDTLTSSVFKAGNPTIGTDETVGAAAGSVVRTFLDKSREIVSVFDFGVVGDNVADDTVALQAAIDFCDATGKILDFGSAKMKTSAAILAVGSFGGIICADAFAGLYPIGSGYTAITIGIDSLTNPFTGTDGSASFRVNNLDLAVFGTGNTVNGILLNFISLSVVKRLRAYNLNGFGVKMDWANNSTFEHISTEQCGQENNAANGYTTVYAIDLVGGLLSAEINQNTFVKIECESSRDAAFHVDALAYGNHFCSIHSERASVTESYNDQGSWVFGGSTSVFDSIQLQSFDNANTSGARLARFITANCIFNVIRADQVICHFETWGNAGTLNETHTQVNSLRCEPMLDQPTPTLERPNGYFSQKVYVKTDSEHYVNFNDCSIALFDSSNGKSVINNSYIRDCHVQYMNVDNLILNNCYVEAITNENIAYPNYITMYNTTVKSYQPLAYTYANKCFIGNRTISAVSNVIDLQYRTLELIDCVIDEELTSTQTAIIAQGTKFLWDMTEVGLDHASLLNSNNWYYGTVSNFNTAPATTATQLVPVVGMRHYNPNPTVAQPKSWVCTNALTPTWTSEGNL